MVLGLALVLMLPLGIAMVVGGVVGARRDRLRGYADEEERRIKTQSHRLLIIVGIMLAAPLLLAGLAGLLSRLGITS